MIPLLRSILNNLKKLTLFEHHDKEEQILFKWMLEQNPNADVSIINRIKSDHSELEILLKKILKQSDELEYDLMNFMQMYREHIDLEENFIFLIAQGLLTATELNRC